MMSESGSEEFSEFVFATRLASPLPCDGSESCLLSSAFEIFSIGEKTSEWNSDLEAAARAKSSEAF